MKKVKKFFENGRTMLEMLAVLAIIASIGIGISAGINHGLMIYRASVLKTQLPQIQKAVENTYSFVSGDRKYANVGYATQDQYEDMFGDIFGKNACAENEDKKGCKTAAGHMQIFPILNGLGFKTRIYDMPRDICLELLDSIRNEGGALYAKGLIMSNPCNKDSKQTVEFASLSADFSNMDETGEACPGNQIYDPDAVGDDPKCICLHPDAIGEECLLPENETHDNDNNSGVVSSDTTTTTTAVQYTSKEATTAAISTSLEHTAATNASMVYNSDAGTTTSPTTTVATETTTPYATEPTSYVPETTTAGMTTQTPTMTPTTTATTAPLTTTNNGVANVGDGNTTAILAITTAEPTTTAGMTTQTPTMTPTTTATPTTTMTTEPTTTRSLETTTPYATEPTSYVPETTTAGMTTQTPTTTGATTTATQTATATPTTTATRTLSETTTATATATPTTTATRTITETTTPYATQPASYVPETTTAGMTTQTPTTTGATTTATQTATATPTTTMTTEPTTTRSLETTTPYATQPASYVPETTTVKQPSQATTLMATPTNEIVSGDAVIKLTDVSLNGFDAGVTCGFYMSGLSYTIGFGLSVSTADGSQPTLALVKSLDWSSVKKACHDHIESLEWLRSVAYIPEGETIPLMVGDVKNVDYSGPYSEDPFVSYYLVKGIPTE